VPVIAVRALRGTRIYGDGNVRARQRCHSETVA
jgi:hypothetical protein